MVSVEFVGTSTIILSCATGCGVEVADLGNPVHSAFARRLANQRLLSQGHVSFRLLEHVSICHLQLYKKLMPIPNCRPFLASSPCLLTRGNEKLSSNLAAG